MGRAAAGFAVTCFAGPEVNPAETQPGLHGIQRGHQAGLLSHADITLDPSLPHGVDLPDRRPHGVLGLLPESVETPIEKGDELLLVLQFLV
ncbi:hypothetical protein [Streptomyces sp. NPDC126933]|uniref:hypothetical protein n=1 Tax=unclassified Streptomyces TaxID=2593676 RepID=UPI003657C8FD